MPEPTYTATGTTGEKSTSSPLLIAAAWLLVLIPTAWGFKYTVQNAVKIFDRAPAQTTPQAPAPAQK